MTQLTIHSNYQQNVQQLKFLLEQGPSGVQIVGGLFKALAPNMVAPPFQEVATLAQQKVAQINLVHDTMTADSADRDNYFENAQAIAQWNDFIGQAQIWGADSEKLKINYQGSLPLSLQTPLAEIFNFSLINKEQLPIMASPKAPAFAFFGDFDAIPSDQNLRDMRVLLSLHPAILLRGFNVKTPEDFKRVFEQFVGTTDEDPTRQPVAPGMRIYPSSTFNPSVEIPLHAEFSHTTEPSHYVGFHCKEAPTKGGETTLALCQEITHEIQKTDLWSRYQGQTLHYTSSYSAEEWVRKFGADKAEVEKKFSYLEGSCQWNEDGSLDVLFVAPATRKIGGVELWYNQINLFANTPNQKVTLADGSPIPQKDVEQINAILQKSQASFRWEQNDVLLINNLESNPALHGRKPTVEGARDLHYTMTVMEVSL